MIEVPDLSVRQKQHELSGVKPGAMCLLVTPELSPRLVCIKSK